MYCFVMTVERRKRSLGDNLKGNSCTDSAECGTGGFCNFDSTTIGTCEYCKDIISCQDETFVTQKGKDECKSVCEVSTTKISSTKPTEASIPIMSNTQPTKAESLFNLTNFISRIQIISKNIIPK